MLALIVALVMAGFAYNRSVAITKFRKLRSEAGGKASIGSWHSQASYHGYFTAWMVIFVTLGVFILGLLMENASSGFNVAWIVAMLAAGVGTILLCGRTLRDSSAPVTMLSVSFAAC